VESLLAHACGKRKTKSMGFVMMPRGVTRRDRFTLWDDDMITFLFETMMI